MNVKQAKPSVRIIAGALGISAMTVTRVLHAHPQVSPATRRKVLAKVKELGYDFPAASTTLRNEREQNVAIHCRDSKLHADNLFNFFIRLYYLCLKRLKAEKLQGMLVDLDDDWNVAVTTLDTCASLIVLGPISDGALSRVRQQFPKLRIVTVLSGESNLPSVQTDDFGGGVLAATQLHRRRYRRVAVFANLTESSFKKRLTGFLGEYRLLAPEASVEILEFPETGNPIQDDESKRAILDRCFDRPQTEWPEAFFIPNCYAAFFSLKYLSDRGLRVPDQIGLLGYDNNEALMLASPEVGRIVFELKDLATHAVLLLQLLKNNHDTFLQVAIPNNFIEGASLRFLE